MELLGALAKGPVLPKRPLVTALAAWVLLCPSVVFYAFANARLLPALAAVGLLVSVLVRRPLALTTRSVVYALTLALTLVVLFREALPINDEHFFMPAALAFPLLIGLGVAATFFVQNPVTLAAIIALAVTNMMVQGSCLKDPDPTVFAWLPGTMWRDRYFVFGLFVGLQMLGLLPLLALARAERGRDLQLGGPGLLRHCAHLVAVVIFAGLTVGTCIIIERSYARLDALFNPLLEAYIRRAASRTYYSNKVDLREALEMKNAKSADRIVLRARARLPPGYLRARAYEHYQSGIWSGVDENLPLAELGREADLSAKLFAYPGIGTAAAADELARIDVYPAAAFPSKVLLAAGNTQAVELVAERLFTDRGGSLRPKEWETHGGYTLRVPKIVQGAAFALPAREQKDLMAEYLVVPDDIWADLQLAAERVFPEPFAPPDRKLQQVAGFLRDHYQYQLGVGLRPARDPVLQFIEDTRAGHCELFAAAAALLLRTQGIPTRYVTGFFCSESHPEPGFWLARLADSHAWVEAYNSQTRQWELVEATPASGLPTGRARWSLLSLVWEYPIILWDRLYSYLKRGYFAEAVKLGFGTVLAFVVWALWEGPWQIGWTVLGVLGAAGLIWWRRRQAARYGGPDTPTLRLLHRSLARLERHLRLRGVLRHRSTTLRDLAAQVRRRRLRGAEQLAALLVEYEALRYQAPPADAAAVQAFHARLKAALRHLPVADGPEPASP